MDYIDVAMKGTIKDLSWDEMDFEGDDKERVQYDYVDVALRSPGIKKLINGRVNFRGKILDNDALRTQLVEGNTRWWIVRIGDKSRGAGIDVKVVDLLPAESVQELFTDHETGEIPTFAGSTSTSNGSQ
jgi:hypothetical protein